MRHWFLRLAALTIGAILLTSAYYRISSSTVMTQAAQHFLASLTPEQHAKAAFTFQDDERLNWHFIPRERKGLPLLDMTPPQRALAHAESCYRRGAESRSAEVRAEALYRLALWHRRERRFIEAAAIWREVLDLTEPKGIRRIVGMRALRQFAAEALAIHHEHRDRDLDCARELALFALEDADGRRADGMRHRLARLERKIAKKTDAQLLWS